MRDLRERSDLDALTAAGRSTSAIYQLGGAFMLDLDTYVVDAPAHGFAGLDFYHAGRSGVLGPADADVVAAVFVFHDPEIVRVALEAGRAVMPPADAALAWAASCHRWSRAKLRGGDPATGRVPAADADGPLVAPDLGRLADLAGTVTSAASTAAAPIFAGWRGLPEPPADDVAALAGHRVNGLRELRGAHHSGAVVAVGLHPRDAVAIHQPEMSPTMWGVEADPEAKRFQPLWAEAEALTNRAFARDLEVLSPSERSELVTLLDAAWAAACS